MRRAPGEELLWGKMLRTVWDMVVGGVQGGIQESARPPRLDMGS